MQSTSFPRFGQSQPNLFQNLAAARDALRQDNGQTSNGPLGLMDDIYHHTTGIAKSDKQDGILATLAKTLGLYYAANTALDKTVGEGGFWRKAGVFVASYLAAKQVQVGTLLDRLLKKAPADHSHQPLDVTA